jgi:hypothetical protein
MLSTIAKKNSIKNVLKWVLGGFSIFFIAMLVFMLVHDSIKQVHLPKQQNIVQSMAF